MQLLAGILSLLIAAAGWYYMFYSRAAQNLSAIEAREANRKRVTLRRINGFTMVVLAIVLYIGVAALARTDASGNSLPNVKLFLGMMVVLLVLIVILLVLGLMDLRLTHDLRKRFQRDRDEPPTA
jgi:hypothetical protein